MPLLSSIRIHPIRWLLVCLVLAGIVYVSVSRLPPRGTKSVSPPKFPPSGVQAEIETLSSANSNSVSRALAAGRLRRWKEDAAAAIPQLINTLNDTDPLQESWTVSPGIGESRNTSAANEALETLVQLGARSVDPLMAALNDSRGNVRAYAAEGLGRIRDARAIQPLINALADKNWFVREKSALALGELKDKRAVDPLIVTLEQGLVKENGMLPSKSLLDSVQLALQKITGQDFKLDVAKWRAWSQQEETNSASVSR